MYTIEHNTIQLLVSIEESHKLHKEFEKLFIAANTCEHKGMYSDVKVKERYPKISELFTKICK